MRAVGIPYPLLTKSEIEKILHSALQILQEMGMIVENNVLIKRLKEADLPVDFDNQRVRFPQAWVERWIADTEKTHWDNIEPKINASAGVYFSRFHDPMTNSLLPWSEDRLAQYFNVAKNLKYVGNAVLLGSRLECLPAQEPLYERYYAWKYGVQEGGSIYLDDLCQPLLELYQIAAHYRNKSIMDIFKATVYVIPALKLGRHESAQVAFFMEHGLQVGIGGSMFSMGANSPVTFAGAVTLNLAEQLAIRILDDVFFGNGRLWISSSIAPLDMRTLIRPFGRPEMAISNLMTAQIAHYLGADFSGHAGLTDAKLPSVEAGYQKRCLRFQH